jgi:hypothetical protein
MSSPSTWRVGIVKQSLRTMLISFLSLHYCWSCSYLEGTRTAADRSRKPRGHRRGSLDSDSRARVRPARTQVSASGTGRVVQGRWPNRARVGRLARARGGQAWRRLDSAAPLSPSGPLVQPQRCCVALLLHVGGWPWPSLPT